MNVQARPEDWEEPVRLPEVNLPRRLLVPFDGSHNAERALAWAATTASATDGEVVVLVGYEQPLTMRGRGAPYIESVREDLETEAKELAAEAVRLLVARGVRSRGIVVKGDVPRAILDMAESEACDLLVIGRQGLSAEVGGVTGALDRMRDMLQGGVADKVVRHSPVPVLVVS
jgi:nucleotide-binding universal stress UspA family protein